MVNSLKRKCWKSHKSWSNPIQIPSNSVLNFAMIGIFRFKSHKTSFFNVFHTKSPHICCSNRCPPVPHSERWKNRAAKGTEVATRGMELKTGVRKASTVKSMARWYLPSGKHMKKTSNQWNPEMAHSMKPRILCGYPALNHWNLRVLGQWAAKMWIGLSGASRGTTSSLWALPADAIKRADTTTAESPVRAPWQAQFLDEVRDFGTGYVRCCLDIKSWMFYQWSEWDMCFLSN